MNIQYILIPITSTFIGYITNVIAIKLLFWPKNPVSFYFFKIQGLLPKRKQDIALRIGELVENELFSLQDIGNKINTVDFHNKIIDSLLIVIKNRLQHLLPGFLPDKVSKLIFEGVEKIIRQEAPNVIEQVLNAGQAHLDKEIKIKEIVAEKINKLDIFELEKMIRNISSTELRFIELLGGVLGFIIGVTQVLSLHFIR